MGFGWGSFAAGGVVGVVADELFHHNRQPQYGEYGPLQQAGYYPLRPGPPGGYPPQGWGNPYAQQWNPGNQGFPNPEFQGANYEGAFGRPPMQGLGNPCEMEARNLVHQALSTPNPDPRCGGPNIQGILQALRNNERLDDSDRAIGMNTEYTKDLYKAVADQLYQQTRGQFSVRTYASAQGRVFSVNEGGGQNQPNEYGQFQQPRTVAWGIINQPRHDVPQTRPTQPDPDAPYPPPTG